MEKQQLMQRLAQLEFMNDQLLAEVEEIDRLLHATGFPRGIESAKEVAEEMLEENMLDRDPDKGSVFE